MKKRALNYEKYILVSITLDISIEDDAWNVIPDLEALCLKAVIEAVKHSSPKPLKGAELSILFSNDAHIHKLNKQWRGQDKSTNVLSFPAVLPDKISKSPVLGDIALAFETIAKEALLDYKTLEHHLTHLVIHGFLHLLGYDHETDADAEVMETLEIKVLVNLNIGNPYEETDLLLG